jgi:hypothetical protein
MKRSKTMKTTEEVSSQPDNNVLLSGKTGRACPDSLKKVMKTNFELVKNAHGAENHKTSPLSLKK